MTLFKHLHSNPTTPIRVVGNGYQTSNIPEGATGTVVAIHEDEYELKWDHNHKVETFNRFGGTGMSLDVTD